MELAPNPKEVGKRIRNIRQQLGLSMEGFAARIDDKAKSGTVSNWETGKNLPNNERLKRISELGNVSLSYLLEGRKYIDDVEKVVYEDKDGEMKLIYTGHDENEGKLQGEKIKNAIDVLKILIHFQGKPETIEELKRMAKVPHSYLSGNRVLSDDEIEEYIGVWTDYLKLKK